MSSASVPIADGAQRSSEPAREKRFRAAHQISQDKLFAKQIQEQWKAERLLMQSRAGQPVQPVKREEETDGKLLLFVARHVI